VLYFIIHNVIIKIRNMSEYAIPMNYFPTSDNYYDFENYLKKLDLVDTSYFEKIDVYGNTFIHKLLHNGSNKQGYYIAEILEHIINTKKITNINIQNAMGDSPLYIVCGGGSRGIDKITKLVQILLDNGADPFQECDLLRTPFESATIYLRSVDIMKTLMNIKSMKYNKQKIIDHQDKNGATLLMRICSDVSWFGEYVHGPLKFLLENNPNLELTDKHNKTYTDYLHNSQYYSEDANANIKCVENIINSFIEH